LPREIPTSGISTIYNNEVQHVMEAKKDGTLHKRGPYEHFSSQEKAKICKYAAEHEDHGSPMSNQIHHTLLDNKRTRASMC